MAKRGLYANIHAKEKELRQVVAKMRKVGSKGAPTAKQFKERLRQLRKGSHSR